MSKKQLFEEMQFDSYQCAVDFRKDAVERYNKANSVFKLSIIGSFIPWLLMGIPTLIIGILCYKKTGGLKQAFSWGWKLAQFGWFIIPVFPIDLAVGLVTLLVVPYFLLFCPAVLVYIFRRQAKKDIEQADEYLKYFKAAEQNNV